MNDDAQRELLARELSMRQQVIDLKSQLDRERQVSEGFVRFGERAFSVTSVDTFFEISAEELLETFGTENVIILRLRSDGPSVVATCCADDVTVDEVSRLAELALRFPMGRAAVATGDDLPTVMGRPSSVVLVGSVSDGSDESIRYAFFAAISRAKAPFYPTFAREHAPLYEAFLNHIGALQKHLRAREEAVRLMRATKHFVPQEFLQALGHADVTTAKLGDAVQRRATILFADIRNFTSLSENMSPAETASFLNTYLSRVGPHVRSNGGFVDKYIGDAIMALFPGPACDAVQAGLAMQAELSEANAQHPERDPVVIGIGIHCGEVMMCTVGEEERFEATVISDTVNLSARLESLTKQLGCSMLVSSEVEKHMLLDTRLYTRRLGRFAVKGKSQSVELVEVFAADPPDLRARKASTREEFEEALAHYRSGKVSTALGIVARLALQTPDDGPMAWWHARMQQDLDSPVPPTSRDVIRLDAK